MDQVYGVGSQNGLDVTKASIQRVVDACPYALKDRQHDVLIAKLNADSREYDVRVWTNSATYWETYYYMLEHMDRQFAADGIEVPKQRMFVTNV